MEEDFKTPVIAIQFPITEHELHQIMKLLSIEKMTGHLDPEKNIYQNICMKVLEAVAKQQIT